MYLQLAGPAPLDTAENPLAPGAKTYDYDAFYLGQTAEPIPLPDALYKPRVGNFVDGLKTLQRLYKDFASGRKKSPQQVVSPGAMAEPITIAAAVAFLQAVLPAIQAVIGGLSATLVNNAITGLYNQNAYNVQNLNRMTVRELSLQIQNLDNAIATTPRVNFVRAMALGQMRLIYQQRFDAISGTAALGALPAWVLPAALGLGAFLLIRRK